MKRTRGRVVVLGGGMAGLSAAWRLSEPGWRDRFDSITVYQRGWRLGGKGASSRGPHGRIEEHGLHVWLGSYENAFALLRECYAELDRATTDSAAPIRTWDQALMPADSLGIADQWGSGWLVWPGQFARNSELPGEPQATGRELTVVGFLRRALQLLLDLSDSLADKSGGGLLLSASADPMSATWIEAARKGALATLAALTNPPTADAIQTDLLGQSLDALRQALDYEHRPDHKRLWLLLSLLTATARGLIVDGLITDPRGFRAIN
ncbi:MAG TPA: FAD-dependent oxidoreductase, partial [Mycobacterium sp.]